MLFKMTNIWCGDSFAKIACHSFANFLQYIVMDFYSGGDLLTLLMKFNDRLPGRNGKKIKAKKHVSVCNFITFLFAI